MDELEKLAQEEQWGELFSVSLRTLKVAKADGDHTKIDRIFRLLRGAIYLLGYEYGDTECNKNVASIELSCSSCGAGKDEARLVGFASGFLCSKCTQLIAKAFENT